MKAANLADVSVLALLLAVLEGGDALAERHGRRRLRGYRPASGRFFFKSVTYEMVYITP